MQKELTLQQEVTDIILANFPEFEPPVLEDAKKSKKFQTVDEATAIKMAYVLIEETGREVSVFGKLVYIK